MKKLNFILSILFFTIIVSTGVIAPGPNMHLNVTIEEAFLDPEVNDTLIAHLIQNNFDACMVGLAYADVGIFEYYTNFKEYAGLHNYNAVDEMLRLAKNDRERTFAYCWKIHLAQDGPSHNFWVPSLIKKTKIPNYLLHGPAELSVEGRYLDPRSNKLMEQHAEFDALVTKVMGRDWTSEAVKLNTILGGGEFYDKAYQPDVSTFWGKLQSYSYRITIHFVPEKTEIDLKKLMIEETKGVLRGETSSLNPSGEEALKSADSQTAIILYLGTFIIAIILFYLSFRWNIIGFNRNRFKLR